MQDVFTTNNFFVYWDLNLERSQTTKEETVKIKIVPTVMSNYNKL